MKGDYVTRLQRRLVCVAAAIAILGLAVAPRARAQGLVYVEGVDQLGGAQQNIFRADGGDINTALDPNNTANAAVPGNSLWNYRDEGVPEPAGLFSTIYESIQEDSPELRVSILSGLTPSTMYDVYAVYWSDGSNWGVRGGFASSPGLNPIFNRTGGAGATAGTLASSVVWSTPPADNLEETVDNPSPFINTTDLGGTAAATGQDMFIARIGSAAASGTGSLNVFIDDVGSLTDANVRSWFDGLAYAPAGTSVVLSAVIDRNTGALTVRNTTSNSLNIASYSVTSAAGSLNSNNWDNLAVGGNPSITEADPWTVSAPTSPAASVTALTEAETTPTNGAQLAIVPASGDYDNDLDVDGNDFLVWQRGTTVAASAANLTNWRNTFAQGVTAGAGNFNLGNVWVRSPIQDVSVTINLANGQTLTVAPTYTGTAIALGDFNADGAINDTDFGLLVANMDTNVSALNFVEAYKLGDINQSKAIDLDDFVTFRTIYDAANGAGAFAAMAGASASAIPEPGSAGLAGAALCALAAVRRGRQRFAPRAVQLKGKVRTMVSLEVRRTTPRLVCALLVIAAAASDVVAQTTTPITSWWVRANGQGVGAGATVVTAANTNSPVFGVVGDGMVGTADAMDALGNPVDPDSTTYGNADDVTIWAAIPPVSLTNGQEMVFNGQVTFDGVPVTGDTFRFGMYDGPNFTGTYDPNVVETPANLAGVPRMWKGFATRPAGGGAGVGYFDARNPASTNWANVGFTSTFGNPGDTFLLPGLGTGPGQTQTPPNLVIGLSQGPASTGNFGGLGPPALTYNFRITLGRFGVENTMSALLETTTGSYRWTRSATTSPTQDTIPSFFPDEFDRVGFLLSNNMNADRASFANINFTVQQIQSLILDVNTATGAMRIRNASGAAFDITGYRITSAAGSLNFANWTSLDDGEGGDNVGVGWDQSGGSGANALTEVNLTGSRLMNNGDSFSLGNAFNTTGVTTQDLNFFFSTTNGDVVRGVLNYNTTSTAGGVPEPGSLALAALALLAVGGARQRRS